MCKHWLHLTVKGRELLGSDSCIPLDGRVRAVGKIRGVATATSHRLRMIHPDIDGANYYTGGHRTSTLQRIFSFPSYAAVASMEPDSKHLEEYPMAVEELMFVG